MLNMLHMIKKPKTAIDLMPRKKSNEKKEKERKLSLLPRASAEVSRSDTRSSSRLSAFSKSSSYTASFNSHQNQVTGDSSKVPSKLHRSSSLASNTSTREFGRDSKAYTSASRKMSNATAPPHLDAYKPRSSAYALPSLSSTQPKLSQRDVIDILHQQITDLKRTNKCLKDKNKV